MRKINFINDQIYHIYNRGVEKRQLFMSDNDHYRFIHDLFEFNDTAPAGKYSEVRPPTVNIVKRDLLVEILCFCLMPNHFHLILRQLQDGGITQFMKKLGTGYSMYFNEKHERVGSLFQNRFKAILVEDDKYFLQLARYIHLNPLEMFQSDWEVDGIRDWNKANKFLESYRWSSYPDYIGKKNFPSITSRNLLQQFFKSRIDHKKFVNQYIIDDYYKINGLILE